MSSFEAGKTGVMTSGGTNEGVFGERTGDFGDFGVRGLAPAGEFGDFGVASGTRLGPPPPRSLSGDLAFPAAENAGPRN